MQQNSLPHSLFDALGKKFVRSIISWWQVVHFGSVILVIVLSPSSYDRKNFLVIAEHIYKSTWQVLLWFTTLCALISLVLVRIIVVTAISYGLSQYALEVVVRVLVLELIPLGAALFVVLRSDMEVSPILVKNSIRSDIVPRVIATAFSVVTLAAVSSLVALIMAYIVVYGFSPWGFAEYTRMVGRVFDPGTTVAFILKTVLFSLAVSIIPIASAMVASRLPAGEAGSVSSKGTVRLFLALILIEGASLAIKFI